MSLDELSQDPFDVDEFVERLAWRSAKTVQSDNVFSQSDNTEGGDGTGSQQFDPMILHGAFCVTIQQLTEYGRKLDKKAQHLESECEKEEEKQRGKVQELLKENQVPCVMYICLLVFTLVQSIHFMML